MSFFARLLVLLALLMLVLPAPLKASCCPDPAQAAGQSEPASPCHGDADDGAVSVDADCAGDCCPCRAPADLPVALSVPSAPMLLQVTDATAPMLSGAQRIPPLPPPIV